MNKDSIDFINSELIAMGFEEWQNQELSKAEVIEAYQQRFPTCKHPKLKTYDDGSQLCICPSGAIGELDQTPSLLPWEECLNCPIYQKKED